MSFDIHVSKLLFANGTSLDLNPNQITVFVGPNNSGKSRALRDIEQAIQHPINNSPILKQIEVKRKGTEKDLINFLDQYFLNPSHAIDHNSRFSVFSNKGLQTLSEVDAMCVWRHPSPILQGLTPFMCLNINTKTRLSSTKSCPRTARKQGAQHPYNKLEFNDSLMKKMENCFFEAFEEPLSLDRSKGSHIGLTIGNNLKPDSENGEDRVSSSYLDKIAAFPELDEQGDGMKSFATILLYTLTSDQPIILIDEPEAFLHPPQAKILARLLAQEHSNRQIFLATHSSDVVQGLLEETDNIAFIRLDRIQNYTTPTCLTNDKIKRFWNDPTLQRSKIIDGIFHEKTVICEADTDGKFYETIAIYGEIHNAHKRKFLFIGTGGKAKIPIFVRYQRELGIPTVVIVDFDILQNEHELSNLVQSFDGDWKEFQSTWNSINDYILTQRPLINFIEFQKNIQDLNNADEYLTPKNSGKIKDIIRQASSPWNSIKKKGLNFFEAPMQSKISDLLQDLAQLNIFVVPIGELESWIPKHGHGARWLDTVFSECDLKKDPRLIPVKNFLENVLDNNARSSEKFPITKNHNESHLAVT